MAIETSITKFLDSSSKLPQTNIAYKQCLQLSKEMADKNQTGLMGKKNVKLCIAYTSSSITLSEKRNEKRLLSLLPTLNKTLGKCKQSIS